MVHQTLSRAVIGLALLLLAPGCSTTFVATRPDAETGRFSTSTRIPYRGVRARAPFDLKYRELLYVKTDGRSTSADEFFLASFKSMPVFTTVVDGAGFESLVRQRRLMEREELGPFLVVEPSVRWHDNIAIAELRAIDPATGATVLSLHMEAYRRTGLDEPLFFPLFNAFLDWAEGGKISMREFPRGR